MEIDIEICTVWYCYWYNCTVLERRQLYEQQENNQIDTVQLVQTLYHTYVHHTSFTLPHSLIFGAQHHPRRTLLRITIFSTYRVQSTDTGTLYTSFISSACQPLQKLTSSTYLRICTLCMYVYICTYVRYSFVHYPSKINQKTS